VPVRNRSSWQQDVRDWPAGLYLVTLDGAKRTTIKIVKTE